MSTSGDIAATSEVTGINQYLHYEDQKKLGAADKTKDVWRVTGKNKLTNTHDFISFYREIVITAKNSECVADISYNLKSGYHDYRYERHLTGNVDGGLGVANWFRAHNVTCVIGQS